jgi:hypothetical protein
MSNQWTEFLSENGGQGYSMSELSRMYNYATPKRSKTSPRKSSTSRTPRLTGSVRRRWPSPSPRKSARKTTPRTPRYPIRIGKYRIRKDTPRPLRRIRTPSRTATKSEIASLFSILKLRSPPRLSPKKRTKTSRRLF